MSSNNSSKLKVSGMLAAVIVVVGTIAIISNSTLLSGSGGVSADVADLATGKAIIMPLSIHQEVIEDLNSYFELQGDKVAQDKIIEEVVNTLSTLVN